MSGRRGRVEECSSFFIRSRRSMLGVIPNGCNYKSADWLNGRLSKRTTYSITWSQQVSKKPHREQKRLSVATT